MAKKSKTYTKEEALQKAYHYCDYQERCHQEVWDKLMEWEVVEKDALDIMEQLKSDNLLNEQRFAKSFARGRFRLKKWGKIKIRKALERKQVAASRIEAALQTIHDEDYRATLEQLIQRKWERTALKNTFDRKGKVAQYVIRKGYEPEQVWEYLHDRCEEDA